MIKNKKGLSNVIATVLIILLALAAVVIIWTFIRASIQQTGESSDLANRCLNSEVVPVSCNAGTDTVIVKLSRGEASFVKAVAENPTTGVASVSDNSFVNPADTSQAVDVLETVTVNAGITINSGDVVSAAVGYVLQDGSFAVCDASPAKITCA